MAGQVLEEIDQQGWNNMPLSCVSAENALQDSLEETKTLGSVGSYQ